MTGAPRPTCFIHIGPPKTGSSSIKHFIWNNEDKLYELGLFFPKLLGPGGKRARNHESLAISPEIDGAGDLKPDAILWPEIEAVAKAGAKNILLSSEMFSRTLTDPEVFDPILNFFDKRGYRVVVLAYVRDQPAWLNSWYVQSQKRFARLLTFEQFVEEAAELGRVEPDRYLAAFLGHPRCELVVIPFDKAAKEGLVNDFIGRCGVPTDAPFDRSPVRNTNAGAKTVFAAQEIMRRLDAPEGLKTIPGYAKVYNNFNRRARRLDWDDTPFVAIDQRRYEAIRASYAASNGAFARSRLGVSWNELCPPRAYEPSMFDPAKARPREIREIEKVVSEVVDEFRQLCSARGALQSKSE